MKKILLSVFFFCCSIHVFYAQQEDGVVSYVIPPGNSLKFNSFVINPTFSFVRQQSAYITLFNKSQWTGFENAPKTYLLSYSGRFRENEGVALGIFQQTQGVLSTTGLVANFAHNILLQEDSNLTFGVNLSAYKSGVNSGKVISNYPDPSLDNIPSNTVMAINPGINYGTAFFDFGLAFNNLVTYNFNSGILKDDPNKGIEGHVMYTGFIDSYGFFDKSKFSGLVKTEINKEKTIFSGSAMFTIPKGIWVQGGYHSVLGMTAGVGLNITPKIALEYSYGMGLGDISDLGASHIIVLAYKFKNNNFDYGDDEEEGALIEPAPIQKTSTAKPKADTKTVADAKATQQQKIAENRAKLAADAKAKADAVEEAKKAKLAADAKAKSDAVALALANKKQEPVSKAKLAADAKAKADADASAKLIADAKAKEVAKLAAAKLAADNKAKADADVAAAKLAADAKVKADADAAAAKLAADNKAKADAAAAKLAADAKVKADADTTAAKLAADNKAKADADAAAAKLAADAKAKADADVAAAKLAVDNKVKADADAAAAKLAADAKAKADADVVAAKLAADNKVKADADVVAAKLAADNKVKADADAAAAKLAADAKVKADADATAAKLAADNKAKADADAAAVKLAADAKAKADADATAAKLAADNKAKADADAAAAKLAADAKVKADADATAAKLAADNKAKADADAAAVKLAADATAKAKADADAATAKLAADAKAKADADATAAKLAADNKAKADADAAAAKLAADAKAKADADATAAKLAADNKAKAKAKADADAAAAKLAADAKVKADADAAAAKLAADNKAKADAAAAKLAADAAAQAEQDKIEAAAAAKLAIEALAKAKADAMPKDEYGKSMDNLTKTLEDSKRKQQQLLSRLDASVANKQKALKEMREENDLSDKGIVKTTVEFKSTSGENAELESIKAQIAEVNRAQAESLDEFNRLYAERLKKTPKNDLINQNYLKTIENLKAEQAKAEQSNAIMAAKLEQIKVETEIEKKRRIKRAASLNDQDRYAQDLATLKRIKETTKVSTTPLKPEDFDFGESQSNMQIIKNNKNVESGYYVILAVHTDAQKRDAFVTKTVAAGQKSVNFFYDASSSKYFIYEAMFDNLDEATQALGEKGKKPYNGKMVIVKIQK
jgi:type IX secretion system PorP/SprF family membrane protein